MVRPRILNAHERSGIRANSNVSATTRATGWRAELDLVVLQRAERRAGRRDLIAVAAVLLGQPLGAFSCGEDRQHTPVKARGRSSPRSM